MPLDYLSVKHQIEEQARQVPGQLAHLSELQDRAEKLLVAYADKGDEVRDKIAWALSGEANLRCAIPTKEPLDYAGDLPAPPAQASIIAVDGSQIYPSNHENVNYSLVNLGAIHFEEGSQKAPQISSEVHFRLLEYSQGKRVYAEDIDLERNKLERVLLARLAGESEIRPVITLTDGPLELWGSKSLEFADAGSFSDALAAYLASLRELQAMGAATAGYVAKPRAGLVSRTLEVLEVPRDEPAKVRELRSLPGVSDLFLFGRRLKAGQRSALFELQTPRKREYGDDLALHFFYLNVGTDENVSLARVEVPAWVVEDGELLDAVHAILFEQCQFFGTIRYPYVLHRAHEEALVSYDQRDQISRMLADKLLSIGIGIDGKSAKQEAKDM